MSTDDDRRTLERFVAGVPVEDAALAGAVARHANERGAIVASIVDGLADDRASVRRRLALRAAAALDLDPAIAARLRVLVDQDPDPRVREASAAALRAHDLPVPGEPSTRPAPATFRLRLALKLVAVRDAGTERSLTLKPEYQGDATGFQASLQHDGLTLQLEGLPADWAGSTPVLLTGPPDARLRVGSAVEPVGPDGVVRVRLELPPGSDIANVAGWLRRAPELVVADA